MNPICRYCDKPIEGNAAPTFAYWFATPFVCHLECKTAGERQEAFDCQIVDADCNDCRYYQRGKLAPVLREQVKTIDGRMVEVVFKPNVFVGGRCLKFDKPTPAFPNKWTGRDCFVHRRAA